MYVKYCIRDDYKGKLNRPESKKWTEMVHRVGSQDGFRK